jgi:hypothetical protein
MNYLFHLLIVFSFLLQADRGLGQNQNVQIRFNAQLFTLLEVNDQSEIPSLQNEEDVAMFIEHFELDDYQKYRSYYYDDSCLLPAEDYQTWKQSMKGREIQILARYLLKSNDHILSIIQYKIGINGQYLYGPFTLQKINNQWYLLDLVQSKKLMDVKSFFTYIKPDILKSISNPSLLSQDSLLKDYTYRGGIVDGEKLLLVYPARYDENHHLEKLSTRLFFNISELKVDEQNKLTTAYKILAAEYQINEKTMGIVERMCREGNATLALEVIFQESSAETLFEVTEKLTEILTKQP